MLLYFFVCVVIVIIFVCVYVVFLCLLLCLLWCVCSVFMVFVFCCYLLPQQNNIVEILPNNIGTFFLFRKFVG